MCFCIQADNEQLEAKLAAANNQLTKLQQQLDSLLKLQEGLQASLQGKQSAEASLMTELTEVTFRVVVRLVDCYAACQTLWQGQLSYVKDQLGRWSTVLSILLGILTHSAPILC